MEETQEEKEFRFYHASLLKFIKLLRNTSEKNVKQSLELIPVEEIKEAILKLDKACKNNELL